MTLGNTFLAALQFSAFEAKVGLSQKFDLANKSTQVGDPAGVPVDDRDRVSPLEEEPGVAPTAIVN